MPNASAALAMVFAVYIPPQAPSPGQIAFSISVTASVQSNDRAQAQRVAVDGFVAKPFEPDELIALIAALSKRRRG